MLETEQDPDSGCGRGSYSPGRGGAEECRLCSICFPSNVPQNHFLYFDSNHATAWENDQNVQFITERFMVSRTAYIGLYRCLMFVEKDRNICNHTLRCMRFVQQKPIEILNKNMLTLTTFI